jgi:membrane protease YdiL (CAAX protease family)
MVVVVGIVAALGGAILLLGPVQRALEAAGLRWDVASTFRRLWLVLTLIAFGLALRPWRDVPRGAWGLWGASARPLDAARGVAIAGLLLGVLLGAEALAGWFAWDAEKGPAKWASRWPGLVAGAAVVAVVEEAFFRGWLLDRCLARWRPLGAAIVSAVVYSVPHVFKPSAAPRDLAATPAGALEALRSWAEHAIDPVESLPRLAGLFLLGVALAGARLRTRSLWLGIGVHGGALFLILATSALTERTHERNWAGSKWLYDGPPGWALLLGLALLLWPRTLAPGTPSPPSVAGPPSA